MEKRTAEISDLKLYNLADVSEIMGLTHRTIWNYVKAGKLKARKIGREWKVTERELREFIGGE